MNTLCLHSWTRSFYANATHRLHWHRSGQSFLGNPELNLSTSLHGSGLGRVTPHVHSGLHVSFSSSLCQEDSRWSQEVQEGLRHRAQRPVVYGVPLEESLPTLPRLNTGRTRTERRAANFSLTWWMFSIFLRLKPEIFFVFVLFLLFVVLNVFCRCCFLSVLFFMTMLRQLWCDLWPWRSRESSFLRPARLSSAVLNKNKKKKKKKDSIR